ncbi:MAG TPA: hypothetical protein DCG75_11055 [Bacteroidales bacterium]|jgi:hypothetical protein|nr:hypothetical protein [Bacteroidales bacterium]
MKKAKILYILVFTLLINLQATAGWVITQQSYDSDEGVETALIETIYLQGNIMKVVQPEMVTMFNLNTEMITIMSPVKKVYWTGKVADYKKEIKDAMQLAMEEQLKTARDEQKEMIRKMYQGMMESIDNPSKFAGEEPEEYELKIEKTGEKERIAGHIAYKYSITVNEAIKEEAWLSESSRPHEEFDINKFYTIFGDFTSQAGTHAFYQNNEKYIEFAKKGFPLKSINYNGGYESISEVTNLKKSSVEASEFIPPADYQKVSLLEIGLEEQE